MSFSTSNLALASELAAEYEGIAQRLTIAVEHWAVRPTACWPGSS